MSEQEKQKAAQELFDYISELSREAIFASWFVDIEYCLWERMQEGAGQYYMLDVDEDMIQRLKDYSNKADGWWSWEDREPVFLSIENWVKLYDKYPERRIW